jgi:hypothetical protein
VLGFSSAYGIMLQTGKSLFQKLVLGFSSPYGLIKEIGIRCSPEYMGEGGAIVGGAGEGWEKGGGQ